MKLQLIALGSAAALGTAGAAAADNGHAKHALTMKAHVSQVAQHSDVGPAALFDAAAAYLKIDAQTLFQDLRNGQSLAQIAVAQGKTADGLVSAVVAAAKTQLDEKVAAGKLDASKEQVLLTKLSTALGTLVTKSSGNAAGKAPTTRRPMPATLFLQPVLDYLHLDIQTVLNDLRNGQSLAQIAVAQGKTADGLATTIATAAKTPLDNAVASGKLTAAQEASLFARIQKTVAMLVNRSHG